MTRVQKQNDGAAGSEGVAEVENGLGVFRHRLDCAEGMDSVGVEFCGKGGSLEFLPLIPHPLLLGPVNGVAVGETAHADEHALNATDDSDVPSDGGVHGEGGVGDAQHAVVGGGMTTFDGDPSRVVVRMDVPFHKDFAAEQLVEMVHQETKMHVSRERHGGGQSGTEDI